MTRQKEEYFLIEPIKVTKAEKGKNESGHLSCTSAISERERHMPCCIDVKGHAAEVPKNRNSGLRPRRYFQTKSLMRGMLKYPLECRPEAKWS